MLLVVTQCAEARVADPGEDDLDYGTYISYGTYGTVCPVSSYSNLYSNSLYKLS